MSSAATQDSYWLGNARVMWSNARYDIEAYVENFTDELYAVNRVIFNTPAALNNVGGQFAAPRTFGVRLAAHF